MRIRLVKDRYLVFLLLSRPIQILQLKHDVLQQFRSPLLAPLRHNRRLDRLFRPPTMDYTALHVRIIALLLVVFLKIFVPAILNCLLPHFPYLLLKKD